MRRVIALMAPLLLLAISAAARADSWLPPETRTYVSADGAWRLTIKPRELSGALDFFKDKLADRPKAGGFPGDAQASAIGRMEHREEGQWRTVWGRPLTNDVSPVDAMALSDGRAVTFDNWHGMGYGDDVIAIYDAEGALVRRMGLSDFLPKEFIQALPHSVSSIQWRGEPQASVDGAQLIVPVVVPVAGQDGSPDSARPKFVDVRFQLSDGRRIADSTSAWTDALVSAHLASQRLKAEQAAARLRFISPLSAPGTSEIRDWYDYLVEAFFRLDPDWKDGYPATKVIPLPTDRDFELLCRYVGEALSDESNSDGAIMVASPSQDLLVKILTKQVQSVRPGSLAKARLYVPVDRDHVEAVRAAVARTGVRFIPIDIGRQIPQRRARLDAFLKNFKAGDE
jgi:hypothetical protein